MNTKHNYSLQTLRRAIRFTRKYGILSYRTWRIKQIVFARRRESDIWHKWKARFLPSHYASIFTLQLTNRILLYFTLNLGEIQNFTRLNITIPISISGLSQNVFQEPAWGLNYMCVLKAHFEMYLCQVLCVHISKTDSSLSSQLCIKTRCIEADYTVDWNFKQTLPYNGDLKRNHLHQQALHQIHIWKPSSV